MATKILSNDFMHQTAVSEAWKELSENFSWSEALLEKYQDQVDWHEISCNSNVVWTVPMVQKFKNRIDWNKFSEYASETVMTEPFLDAFKEKWNWSELSDNRNLTMTHELLEKYADKWDWEHIINIYPHHLFEDTGMEFYEKYKNYIPTGKLQNSSLWNCIVEQLKIQLMAEITA